MKLLNVFVFSLQETKEKHTKQKPTVAAALGAVLGVGFGVQEAAAWSAHINELSPDRQRLCLTQSQHYRWLREEAEAWTLSCLDFIGFSQTFKVTLT